MEKKQTNCNYHSMAEFAGFLVLESVLRLLARLHKLSLRFFTYCPRARGECKSTVNKVSDDQGLGRGDVEIVMKRLCMPLSHGSNKMENWMDLSGVSAIFEEEEPSLEEVKEAFEVFDENCDGFIDTMELQRVLCKLGFREGADLDACRGMIEQFDDNKDGMVDFCEFARFMESSFC